jgi:hypothetical protein
VLFTESIYYSIQYDTSIQYTIEQPFCGDTTNIEWDPSTYPYTINTDTTNDYFLDFVDKTSELFSSFGVYYNGQKMYAGQTDIIMSNVLNHISTLTTKPIRVFCSICRNQCSNVDENKYIEMTHPINPFENMSPDEYGYFDDLATMDP